MDKLLCFADVDHTGVPNAQLIKENAAMGDHYAGKSVAEQNSVDLAWNLLMEDRYRTLRKVIYTNEAELQRFRQLVVNSVMVSTKDFHAVQPKS